METDVTFTSDGLTLAATLRTPPGLAPGDRQPGIVVMHGFGGHRKGIRDPALRLPRLRR